MHSLFELSLLRKHQFKRKFQDTLNPYIEKQKKTKGHDKLEPFKKEIKTWKPDNCPCRLCNVYIESVGFL